MNKQTTLANDTSEVMDLPTKQDKIISLLDVELQALGAHLTNEGYEVDSMHLLLQVDGEFNIQVKKASKNRITFLLEVETSPVFPEVESSHLIASIVEYCGERNEITGREVYVNLNVEYGI